MDDLTYRMLELIQKAEYLPINMLTDRKYLGECSILISNEEIENRKDLLVKTELIEPDLKTYLVFKLTELGKKAFDKAFSEREFERKKEQYYLDKVKADLEDRPKNNIRANIAIVLAIVAIIVSILLGLCKKS